jgi:hypothetical protein
MKFLSFLYYSLLIGAVESCNKIFVGGDKATKCLCANNIFYQSFITQKYPGFKVIEKSGNSAGIRSNLMLLK